MGFDQLSVITKRLFAGIDSPDFNFVDAAYVIRLFKHDFVYDEDDYRDYIGAVTARLSAAGVDEYLILEVISLIDLPYIIRNPD